MTVMTANVNVCVTLNEVEGSFDIYTPTLVKESKRIPIFEIKSQ